MRIEKVDLYHVFVPYRPPLGPYQGNRGEPCRGPGALLARVRTDDGVVGWGEGKGEADPEVVRAAVAGVHLADVETLLERLAGHGVGPAPRSAVEMAVWDALGRTLGLPLCRLLGGVYRTEIEWCGCIGLKEPAHSVETCRVYVEEFGFRYVKTKAGRNLTEDLAIARALQEAWGDRILLRPDANSGYPPDQAAPLLREMKALGIYAYEDPCSSDYLAEMAAFRRDLGLRIANNMGVGNAASALRIAAAGAADFLMPDFPAAGGILPVKQLAAAAAAAGLGCLMHCAHDLGLKTAAVAHVAASTPTWLPGSDTCYHGLTDDILTEPLAIRGGAIEVPLGPGLGVDVDEEKVRAYQV
ncbi:MAG: mandelate racemase/muconate lactonizing enzyme family protein [Armatimonadetes bacterium]|nr:mandelate racemase/muconate lactonizing enzyme family protein [Armatimonadota bacterium]